MGMLKRKNIKKRHAWLECDKCRVIGKDNHIWAIDTIVCGTKNTIEGKYNTIEGDVNIGLGEYITVKGSYNRTFGARACIEGNHNTHDGHYVVVKGDNNTIKGDYAKVDGTGNIIHGNYAVVNGIEIEDTVLPTKEETKFDEESSSSLECVICKIRRANCVISPCMDMHLCVQCSLNLQDKTCPICRTHIHSIKRVHYG